MENVGEVILKVQSLYSKGVPSDDSRLVDRFVYDVLLGIRSVLTTQRLVQNRSYSEWDLQPLHCIEMIEQKPIPCGMDYQCPFMKSKYPIPSAITSDDTENVVVTSFDGQTHFSRTTFENYKYIGGGKYGKRKPFYFIHDNYLYLINTKMEKAHMHGIWRDPIETWRLHMQYQGKSTCFDNRSVKFFTPPDLLETMARMAAEQLVNAFKASREDTSNDSRDSALEETK